MWDPFAVNPIRRSGLAMLVSAAILCAPALISDQDLAVTLVVTVGWMAGSVFVFSIPVFLVASLEAIWRAIVRRHSPPIDELELGPRAASLLRRHGFQTIAQVERTPDGNLLMLSNFDSSALHEVRRAINIWKYRRWQEAGFPADWD